MHGQLKMGEREGWSEKLIELKSERREENKRSPHNTHTHSLAHTTVFVQCVPQFDANKYAYDFRAFLYFRRYNACKCRFALLFRCVLRSIRFAQVICIQFSTKIIISSFLPSNWQLRLLRCSFSSISQSLSIVLNFFACSAFGNGKSSIVLSWTMATNIFTVLTPHEFYNTTACIHCFLTPGCTSYAHSRTTHAIFTWTSMHLFLWAHCSCGIAWSYNRCWSLQKKTQSQKICTV